MIGGVLLCFALGGRETTQPAAQVTAMPATVSLPPARYVRGNACAECHAREYEAWRGSHHDLAMQEANEQTVLGISNAKFFYADVISTFFRRDGKFYVNTDSPDGKLTDYEIKYTFGVTPLQQYLIDFPDGRLHAVVDRMGHTLQEPRRPALVPPLLQGAHHSPRGAALDRAAAELEFHGTYAPGISAIRAGVVGVSAACGECRAQLAALLENPSQPAIARATAAAAIAGSADPSAAAAARKPLGDANALVRHASAGDGGSAAAGAAATACSAATR